MEKLKDAEGAELLQKITSFRYDNNGNELRRTVEYVSLFNKANPKAYEAAVYGEETTEPIHAVVDQTVSRYDGFNRLVRTEIIRGMVRTTVEYAYNGDGLRVEKTVRRSDKGNAAEVTSYLYDRQHVILETRGGDSIRYARGINYIGRIDGTGKLSYFMFNGHGDVVQTVSEAGDVENQYDYDVFGNLTLTVESYLNSIRYVGEFYDVETGLYYLRARYYDPYIGRFISEDSYWGEDSNPLSLNLYTYANNDPIQYVDPTGHSAYDTGRQQVADQVKNESEQGLKDKLNAQKSAYESALKKGNKEEADLYKGRIDAISDMMSGSGGKNGGSSGGRSGKGGGNGRGGGGRDSSKVTVSWEGYIIDIDTNEYSEYKSHGWSVFYGEAYADNMYNSSNQLHSITTSSGRSVTIENSGYIGSIETGEGSYTVISNNGEIGTINTGIGSTTVITNNNKIKVINTGDSHLEKRDSNTTIVNRNTIGEINTGERSENVVFSVSRLSLRTGLNNETLLYYEGNYADYVNADEQKGSIVSVNMNSQGMSNGGVGEQLVPSIAERGKGNPNTGNPHQMSPEAAKLQLEESIKAAYVAKEVGLGSVQTAGGFFETAFGSTVFTASQATPITSIPGGIAGAYIVADGGSNMLGGFTRVVNGITGSDAGDNGNYMKYIYKTADPVNGERYYNISQVAIGGASLTTGALTMATSVRMAGVESTSLIKYTGTGMTALPVITTSNAIDIYNIKSTESTLRRSNYKGGNVNGSR